jgi:chaperonin cofactor prefoldin
MRMGFSTFNQILGLALAALGLWAAIVGFAVPYCDAKLTAGIDISNQLARLQEVPKQVAAQIDEARNLSARVQSLTRLNAVFRRDVRNAIRAEEIIQMSRRALLRAEKADLNVNRTDYDEKWYEILASSGFEVEGSIWYWPTADLIATGDALKRVRGAIGGPPVLEAYVRDLQRKLDESRNRTRHQELYAGLRDTFGASSSVPPGETAADVLAHRLETTEIELQRLKRSLQDSQDSVSAAKEKLASHIVPAYCSYLK